MVSLNTETEEDAAELSEDGLDGLVDDWIDAISDEENEKNDHKGLRRKKGIALCIALGLCCVIGGGYLYLKQVRSHGSSYQKEEMKTVGRVPGTKDQLLPLHPFIVPFKENNKFTYLFLSIVFQFPNKQVEREILDLKDQLRGIIYDIVREEIQETKEGPSLEKLKFSVIEGVNGVLSSGKVDGVYITKFLAL